MCKINTQIKKNQVHNDRFCSCTSVQTVQSLNTWCLLKVLTKSSTSPPSSSPAASSLALPLGARNYKQEVGHDNKIIIFCLF